MSVIDVLDKLLSFPLFGADTDLAWSAVRALVMVCAGILAWALWREASRGVAALAVCLATLLLLKITDDVFAPGTQILTLYFMTANLLWGSLMIAFSQRVNRERRNGVERRKIHE